MTRRGYYKSLANLLDLLYSLDVKSVWGSDEDDKHIDPFLDRFLGQNYE